MRAYGRRERAAPHAEGNDEEDYMRCIEPVSTEVYDEVGVEASQGAVGGGSGGRAVPQEVPKGAGISVRACVHLTARQKVYNVFRALNNERSSMRPSMTGAASVRVNWSAICSQAGSTPGHSKSPALPRTQNRTVPKCGQKIMSQERTRQI